MPGESTQLLETLAKSTCGSCGITCEPGTQDISLCAARDISEIHINAGDLVDRIEISHIATELAPYTVQKEATR